MGQGAADLRREMKRRFAEGDYQGALELAEQVLAHNPEDAIAEAIAHESRAELAEIEELDPIEDEAVSVLDVDVDVDVDSVIDSTPRTPASQASRPTAPPGLSRSTAGMPAVSPPPEEKIAPPPPALPSDEKLDDLDAAWDEDSAPAPTVEVSASAPPPSLADATVAIRGADLDAKLRSLDVATPTKEISPATADSMARTMYEYFVTGQYEAAIRTAKQILAYQPNERLALAIDSQSQTALARERAIVVLVVSRDELSRRGLDARTNSVLAWVDGQRTVREIATACSLSISDTLNVLDDLRMEGLVVLGGDLDR